MSFACTMASGLLESRTLGKGAVMTQPKTHTLDVPGAVLHYDVRSNNASAQPVLLLIGSPMSATGFGTLAGHSPTARGDL